MDIYKNYIEGEWVEGKESFVNINPSDTSEELGSYASAGIEQVSQAIDSATLGFAKWKNTNIQTRAECLDKIGTEILGRQKELGTLLAKEEGKRLIDAMGEVVRAGNIFKYYSGECLRLFGETTPSVRSDVDVHTRKLPIGVCGIISPWNFPIAIPAWKIAPALACGNSVVFKPANIVPASAWALTEIISRSGLPAGTFNLVMGSGRIIGDELVTNKAVRAISFTGSDNVGMSIASQAIKTGKRLQLEMGGKNALVVLDDADIDTAVHCAVDGAFFSTGQRCTASSRLVVTEGIHDLFVRRVKERLAELRVDNAMSKQVDIGPVASKGQFESDIEWIETGAKEGAHLAFGGMTLKRETEGYYLAPTLLTETTSNMRVNQEEIFGPIATVIRVKDYPEALTVANDTQYGLTAGIVTSSLKYAQDFRSNVDAGVVAVNLPTAGMDYHVPFGGLKASSYGNKEQGSYAKDFFMKTKTVYSAT